MSRLKFALAVAAGLVFSTTAYATVMFEESGQQGGSGDLENVLLKQKQIAMVISGFTNQSDLEVLFTGNEILESGPQGQAEITGQDGGFDYLEVTLADPTLAFTEILFNIFPTDGQNGQPLAGKIDLSVETINGNASQQFDYSEAGQNWFRIIATDDMAIKKVIIQSNVNIDSLTIGEAKQFRIGVCVPTKTPNGITCGEPPCEVNCNEVPEPAALLITGSGLVVLGAASTAIRRRKRV